MLYPFYHLFPLRICHLGDVFPVEMAPIAQSQFVPLAEVLCCAVSDMNAAQTVVTQESLLEHLMKNYPGGVIGVFLFAVYCMFWFPFI